MAENKEAAAVSEPETNGHTAPLILIPVLPRSEGMAEEKRYSSCCGRWLENPVSGLGDVRKRLWGR